MNTPSPNEPREERVTAYLLGELDAEETKIVEHMLATDASLASYARRMRHLLGLLPEAFHETNSSTTGDPVTMGEIENSEHLHRLSDQRRHALLTLFRKPARSHASFSRVAWDKYHWVIPVGLAASLILFLGVETMMRLGDESPRELRLGYLFREPRNSMSEKVSPRPSQEEFFAKSQFESALPPVVAGEVVSANSALRARLNPLSGVASATPTLEAGGRMAGRGGSEATEYDVAVDELSSAVSLEEAQRENSDPSVNYRSPQGSTTSRARSSTAAASEGDVRNTYLYLPSSPPTPANPRSDAKWNAGADWEFDQSNERLEVAANHSASQPIDSRSIATEGLGIELSPIQVDTLSKRDVVSSLSEEATGDFAQQKKENLERKASMDVDQSDAFAGIAIGGKRIETERTRETLDASRPMENDKSGRTTEYFSRLSDESSKDGLASQEDAQDFVHLDITSEIEKGVPPAGTTTARDNLESKAVNELGENQALRGIAAKQPETPGSPQPQNRQVSRFTITDNDFDSRMRVKEGVVALGRQGETEEKLTFSDGPESKPDSPEPKPSTPNQPTSTTWVAEPATQFAPSLAQQGVPSTPVDSEVTRRVLPALRLQAVPRPLNESEPLKQNESTLAMSVPTSQSLTETLVEELQVASENAPAPAVMPPPPPPADPLPEVETAQNAFSTFSLNVSDVSFKLAVASLGQGQMPEPGRVRSEEFINAMPYRDPAPSAGARVGFTWEQARNPFEHNRHLIRFSAQTAAFGRESSQPLNLVLLVDNSGSMERSDRVRIVREAFSVLGQHLTRRDLVSVVSFARTPRLWLDGMRGGDAEALVQRVEGLIPQGGTNLEAAMDLAYEIARKHYLPAGNNRIIMLTDGAANLGNVNPAELTAKVETHRRQGIALDCFGVGWEGYNDDLLEVLTRHGDGRYGFLNDPAEAATEFADKLAGALQVAAADVKAQIEFNPQRVTRWRQIGYEKHRLTKEQFRDNTVDAAEIGGAESGTALYSIQVEPEGNGPIGVARVRYKVPSTGQYEEREWVIPHDFAAPPLESAGDSMKLAGVAASFAEWLAQNPYAEGVSLSDLRSYLRGIPERYAPDPRPRQLANMIQQASRLAGP